MEMFYLTKIPSMIGKVVVEISIVKIRPYNTSVKRVRQYVLASLMWLIHCPGPGQSVRPRLGDKLGARRGVL